MGAFGQGGMRASERSLPPMLSCTHASPTVYICPLCTSAREHGGHESMAEWQRSMRAWEHDSVGECGHGSEGAWAHESMGAWDSWTADSGVNLGRLSMQLCP